MREQATEQAQSVLKDIPAYVVGGGSVVGFSMADATEAIQQVGIWFGTALVILTFAHRCYLFWRDTRK